MQSPSIDVELAVIAHQLDSMFIKIFLNLNDSVTLWYLQISLILKSKEYHMPKRASGLIFETNTLFSVKYCSNEEFPGRHWTGKDAVMHKGGWSQQQRNQLMWWLLLGSAHQLWAAVMIKVCQHVTLVEQDHPDCELWQRYLKVAEIFNSEEKQFN